MGDKPSASDGVLIENVNVHDKATLPTPLELQHFLPLSAKSAQFILRSRHCVEQILDHKDKRLMIVVGPCSIHDMKAAREYASKLFTFAKDHEDVLYIVMRVYFEKPRTTIGWKGLINDPDMDDSFKVEKGLRLARTLLIELAEMGLPAATEALDTTIPQYIGELMTWTAIGARTTESQSHRELASGLSSPVGFKNGTDGQLHVAISAMQSARSPHHFMGISQEGQMSVFQTKGNPYGHVVLRGGGGQTNYDAASIADCEQQLTKANLPLNIVVDCSHGNSYKKPSLQPNVAYDCVDQIEAGNQSIVGLMLESNLFEGTQSINSDIDALRYGVSITDACMSWADTQETLGTIATRLRKRDLTS